VRDLGTCRNDGCIGGTGRAIDLVLRRDSMVEFKHLNRFRAAFKASLRYVLGGHSIICAGTRE